MSDPENKRIPSGETVPVINADGTLANVERLVEVKKKSAADLVAEKLGIDYDDDGDNGDLTTSEAGEIGRHLGGPMVKKLVSLAREEMARGHVEKLIKDSDEKK